MCLKLQSPITTPKPDITFYEVGSQVIKSELKALKISIPLGMWDAGSPHYYTTKWGIEEAVKYCRKVYPFPKYKMPRMDCDDFAILMDGLMSAEFGINACAIANGYIPGGYHAYNICRAEDRWVMIEPQTGEVFEFGDKGYQCDRVVI
jgi:hypothetical protein